VHQGEDLLKVRQHAAGELVDQKRAGGMQHRMGLAQDDLPHGRRHGCIGNAGDHVVGLTQVQAGQRGIGVSRRAVNHVQSFIAHPAPKKPDEVAVGLQRNEHRVRPHPPEDLGGEGTDPGSVLEEDPGPGPVHFTQHLVDQKAGAGDQATEHLRMLDEVAAEEQDLR